MVPNTKAESVNRRRFLLASTVAAVSSIIPSLALGRDGFVASK